MFLGGGTPVCGGDVDDGYGGGAWVCGRWFIECLVVHGEFEEGMTLCGGGGGLRLLGDLLLLLLLLLLRNVCVGLGCWDLSLETVGRSWYFCYDGGGFCCGVGVDVLVDGETSHDLVEVSDRHCGKVDG
jgi:hypothetical protein